MGGGDQPKGRDYCCCWKHPSLALLSRYLSSETCRELPEHFWFCGQGTQAVLLPPRRGLGHPNRPPRPLPNSHPWAATHRHDGGRRRYPQPMASATPPFSPDTSNTFGTFAPKTNIDFVVFPMGRFFTAGNATHSQQPTTAR